MIPKRADEAENMSHVVLNLYASSSAPPRIGPTIVPIDPAILNEAAALSLIYELSYIPSFSWIASMISASNGTKTDAVVTPRIRNPVIESALLNSYSSPNSLEGPMRKVPTVATPNEIKVIYLIAIRFAANAINGLNIE
jgi:hypothetical protein